MMEDTYFPDPAHADEIEQACIEIEQCLNSRDAKPLVPARKAVDRYPTDPMILQTAAFAALVEGQPDEALSYIKRLKKRYVPNPVDYLCSAVALAMKGSWPMAQAIYNEQIRSVTNACRLAPHTVDRHWVRRWMNRINDSAAINSPVKKAKLKKAGKKKGASLPEAINDSNPADKPDLVVVVPASCPLPRPQV